MPTLALPPLSKLDPIDAWQPWEPSNQQPWSLKWAGHLLRRAALGATLEELQTAVQRGLAATLDRLFQGDKPDIGNFSDTRAAVGALAANGDEPANLRAWWLYWMLNGSHPLREKLTLFWHNHFATSIIKIGSSRPMFRQNDLLYQHALGKFGPFLVAVSQDPAMLVWLDSNSNVAGKPNENFARELLELFSLGVGHYRETDVREAARAFTGWHTDGTRFRFVADLHDAGRKSILGHTGDWDGGDVIRIVLEQPAAACFLVRKLYRFYVNEAETPPDAFLAPLTDAFRQSDYDVAVLLRRMLGSRHFFSGHAYRQRIKCPVEFCLGAGRALAPGSLKPSELVGPLDAMGQQLFAPPNVKGWEGGQSWLNTSTVLARHNFAQSMSAGNVALPFSRPTLDARATVAFLIDLLVQGDVSPTLHDKLTAYLDKGSPRSKAREQRIRETVHAIMCMPVYQLA
jgi:uncharacterized protein (DUF1800 family)